MSNVMLRDRVKHDFFRTFRVPLSSFWNNLAGFDVCGFDERIVRSGDGSMVDKVRELFGDSGVRIIQELTENNEHNDGN